MPRHVIVFLLLSLVLGPSLLAQRIRWEPPGGSLGLGQTSQLSLIFEDCEPEGEFTLPEIPHLTLGTPSRGEQSSVNIINGQLNRTRTVYYTYPVRPTERATVRIPAFTIETDAGPVEVAGAVFEVGDPTVGGSSIPLDTAANSRISIGERDRLWAGEVVPVNYVLSVASRFPANIASAPEWNPAPLVIEEWSRPEPGSALVNGENRNTMTYRSQGYVRDPGTYTLAPVSQLVNLRVPSSGFNLFQAFQAEQYTITSNTPQLVVEPLPTPAPAAFDGAVGAFELTSKVVPAQAAVGEPVTWTLELTGQGNWPDITALPPREVSREFRVVQPQARRTPVEGRLFEATLTEDVVLIPTRPGTYRLGPMAWSYFNPATSRYETIETPAVDLVVAPAEPVATAGSTGTPLTPPPSSEEGSPAYRANPPGTPPAIPRDPLPGSASVSAPWALARLITLSGLIFLMAPLAWLALAGRRAWLTDAGRESRAAKQHLRDTLAAMRQARTPEEQQRLLRDWQLQSRVFWRLPSAAPAAEAFAPDSAWQQLWQESEQALYRRSQPLPDGWIERAEQAAERRRAPRFPVLSILRGSNLLPLLALLVLMLALPAGRAAETGLEAYGRADFRQAEQSWQQALAQNPRDWIAHHNLALALAQQQRWGEAAAHAAVAFVQNPSNPSVQWHYDYTLGRAGFTPAMIGRFIEPDLRYQVARWLAPSGWQRAILVAVALLVIGILIVLARGYFRLHARWNLAAAFCGVVALTIGLAAGVSLPCYGDTSNANAVLVWRSTTLRSVPTNVPTDQQSSTVAPGSIAVVDGTFLGWRRLNFRNGQTGWVRQEEVVGFWRAP